MIKSLGSLAVLVASLLASPAIAQPGPGEPTYGAPAPQPATVVIVTPAQPIAPQAPGGPGQTPPAAPAAPQNEPWRNVSHINGTPVKVGERGDYLYQWKTTNVATNPIGWMFGFYGISLSHAVHDNVAIRGDANLISVGSQQGYEFGLSLPIYFRRVFQGPFLEVGIVARDFNADDDCYSDGYGSCENDPSVGPEVLFGWHWTFDSGMNMAMAFGAMRDMNHGREYSEPAGYFRIGYAY